MSENTKQTSSPVLQADVRRDLLFGTFILLTSCAVLPYPQEHQWICLITALLVWTAVVIIAWRGLSYHGFSRFGPANRVTTIRAVLTALLASALPAADTLTTPLYNTTLWSITALAILTLSLDGLDGYLARRTALSSRFGARYDMEIDALLALILALFIWRSGEAGIWILGLGLLRYIFVALSVLHTALQAPLYPSFRRKLICVIQLSALCAIVSPLISGGLTTVIGGFALIALMASFARDMLWLYSHDSNRLSGQI